MKDMIQLFKALSDEARLRILNLIFESGDLCVCDIQRVLGFTQTKVSRHLAYLKHSGLVKDRRVGGWMIYSFALTEGGSREILLKNLKDLFQSEDILLKDIEKLHESIECGDCVSVCVLPHQESK